MTEEDERTTVSLYRDTKEMLEERGEGKPEGASWDFWLRELFEVDDE
jgi:hypothetical protein